MWDILGNYFESNPYFISKHHLDSYNSFLEKKIPLTIKSMNPIMIIKSDEAKPDIIKHKIEVYVGGIDGNKIYIDKPVIFDALNNKSRLMLPNDARLNNVTYASDIYCDVDILYHNKDESEPKRETVNVCIGKIPIMLHSKYCHLFNKPESIRNEMGECLYDQGGYFIIDGKEKVIVAQERNITNQIFINKSRDPKYSITSFIRCTSETTSVFPKTIYFKVFSDFNYSGHRKNAIVVSIPHINTEIPLFVLFRVIGIESDKDIIDLILEKDKTDPVTQLMMDFLHHSIIDGNFLYTQQHAIEYLRTFTDFKTKEQLQYILVNNLFPNVESDEFVNKAIYLGYLVNKLLKVCIGINPFTDRDNYMYKRLGISGFMLGDIFKDFYNAFRNAFRSAIDNKYELGGWKMFKILENKINNQNKNEIFQKSIITTGLSKSLKGNWGGNNDPTKAGIVQDLNRISYMSFISHLRRVSSPMDPSIKIRSPHQLNTSQYGFMCPCESPDGASIGLIKNLSILCHITFDVKSASIKEALKYFDITLISNLPKARKMANITDIHINNNWYGVMKTENVNLLCKWIRVLRRNGLINIFTSISWKITQNTVNILCEAGRCCRPLYSFNSSNSKNSKNKNWYNHALGGLLAEGDARKSIYNEEFIDPFIETNTKYTNLDSLNKMIQKLEATSSIIEFLDIEESNVSLIAMYPHDQTKKYTHCEIHPSTMFSVHTASIPLVNHNPVPRIIFAGAQGKQAIGVYATNFNNRIDTLSYVLHYPQRPIVQTQYTDYLKLSKLPNGENVIVAIASYTGYNQEDSIIINKSALDRGLFNLTYFKSYQSYEDVNNNEGERIIFANPYNLKAQGRNVKEGKEAVYKHLDELGFPPKNYYIHENDVVVGKVRIKTNKLVDKDDVQSIEAIRDLKNDTYENASEIADKTTEGFVDKVFVHVNDQNIQGVKIRLRKWRIPELGDKLASRYSQKGVIGMIMAPQDMPFTQMGVVPDIIINPHAFPSRQTIGHLLECIMSKIGCLEGAFVDATTFANHDYNKYFDLLEERGMQRHGDEILYNGITGSQIPCAIFFGPTYYYRLKHMVSDKVNYRRTGKQVSLTHQPTQGRSNEGGLRIGEMEVNCLIAHGVASFTKESLMERSDKHVIYVDNATGDISGINVRKRLYNNIHDYSKVFTPYSFKLLCQELQTMNVHPFLVTEKQDYSDSREFLNEDIYEFEEDTTDQNEQ